MNPGIPGCNSHLGDRQVAMKKLALLILVMLAFLAGCSSEPPKPAEKPQPKPPEFLTGRSAFQKLYISARGWARDAQPFRLESQLTAGSTDHDGKCVVWRAAFASPLQRNVKPYFWAGTDAADAPSRGVSPGTEDSYNPGNSSTQVFDIGFLKVDSDKAFEVAQQHGGEKLLEKAPDTPVLYLVSWSRLSNGLVWEVSYGANRDSAQLNVDVDATTGEFIRTEK
jgi:hypothetical protein